MAGFVYIWLDKKHKRYYVGSHWGTDDDGYVCSSPWMKSAKKRRPRDFKRRILARVLTNREDLLDEEQRWLDMVHPDEIKIRYYNLNLKVRKYWHTYDKSREEVQTKLKGRIFSEEHKRKLSEAKVGSRHSKDTKRKMSESRRGRVFSDETRKKLATARKGKTFGPLSKEHKLKLSEANRSR